MIIIMMMVMMMMLLCSVRVLDGVTIAFAVAFAAAVAFEKKRTAPDRKPSGRIELDARQGKASFIFHSHKASSERNGKPCSAQFNNQNQNHNQSNKQHK
mmetsp:Transcript_6905/g.19980  ORF Transcript_6905/g.19980 Transcript_6905/m.19980 type:complete len:99 (+) Transcript_6905:2-298(+)